MVSSRRRPGAITTNAGGQIGLLLQLISITRFGGYGSRPSPGRPRWLIIRTPMTHPSIHARTQPNKIAYQMAGSGKAITYRELDELSNQGAQLFRALGLKAGDHIAFLIENRLAFMEICWAAQRSGLYYTAISRYLTQDEIAYIVKDCGAKIVITSTKCAEVIAPLLGDALSTAVPAAPIFFMVDEPQAGFRSW